MFSKQYYFYGKHAEYVNKLTAKRSDGKSSDKNICIFNRNIDVFLFASIIGISYNRRSEVDKSKNELGKVIDTSIFADMMVNKKDLIDYNYQTVMMLHNRNTDSKELRLDRAFRYYNKDEEFKRECYDIFNSYILGGVELLYEKIVGNGKNLDDYCMNLYEFLEEFNNRYTEIEGEI